MVVLLIDLFPENEKTLIRGRGTWKVTCSHLFLALGRKFFVGEITFDNLLFM